MPTTRGKPAGRAERSGPVTFDHAGASQVATVDSPEPRRPSRLSRRCAEGDRGHYGQHALAPREDGVAEDGRAEGPGQGAEEGVGDGLAELQLHLVEDEAPRAAAPGRHREHEPAAHADAVDRTGEGERGGHEPLGVHGRSP